MAGEGEHIFLDIILIHGSGILYCIIGARHMAAFSLKSLCNSGISPEPGDVWQHSMYLRDDA